MNKTLDITNLSQLKKAIKEGKQFIIQDHNKKEYIGQIRKPNVIQTNGFYSVIPDEPENKISLANGKRGSWLEYGKATLWDFYKGRCYLYYTEDKKPENLVLAIDFVD